MKSLNLDKNILYDLYIIKKKTSYEIAKILNCSQPTIFTYLKKYKIKSRNQSISKQKLLKNDNYFSIPNIENSYWAGFIAADGNISTRISSNKILTIGLSIKDKKHLENFKSSIKYSGNIKEKINTVKGKKYKTCYIYLYSANQICNDLLLNFNITPRKSLTLQPPNLIELEHQLAYIIGYIDGDGCISYCRNKYLRLQLIGTNNFLQWINTIYNNIGHIRKVKNTNIYELAYNGQNAKSILWNLKNFIIKNNILVLKRKWNKC